MATEKAFVIDLEDGAEYQPLLDGPPRTRGMRSGRVFLRQGEECGWHSTEQHEETLVFLAGNGSAFAETGDVIEVGLGKVAYIPPHTRHNVKNTGIDPLIYIYCVAPVAKEAGE